MMMRPPLFMCFSAACVAMNTPRTLMSITRSISSSVVSSNGFGMAVPALFTSTSSLAEGRNGLFDRSLHSFERRQRPLGSRQPFHHRVQSL